MCRNMKVFFLKFWSNSGFLAIYMYIYIYSRPKKAGKGRTGLLVAGAGNPTNEDGSLFFCSHPAASEGVCYLLDGTIQKYPK
jgi:hypothetical protein